MDLELFNHSFATNLSEPNWYNSLTRYLVSKPKSNDERTTVHLGNPNIGVIHEILIILGISLCTMCLHFIYKHYKPNKIMEPGEMADEKLPSQV